VSDLGSPDQEHLAEIAKNDTNFDVRMAAADRLQDKQLSQAVYARLARDSETEHTYKSAIEKLTDQAVLVRIATYDAKDYKRYLAVMKIGRQVDLAQVARTCNFHSTCEIVVHRLCDQAELAHVAENSGWDDVRIAAADKLYDTALSQRVYAKLATNHENDEVYQQCVRKAAVERLVDQGLLIEIARNGNHRDVCSAAVMNPAFTDEAALVYIAKHHVDFCVRRHAAGKLTDEAALCEIAKGDGEIDVRMAAIRNPNLTDQATLYEIVRSDKWQIIETWWDRQHDYPVNEYHDGPGSEAMKKLTDKSFLAKLAKSAKDAIVREAAITKETNKNK